MHHGPDPYAQALADLDELLGLEPERNELAVIEANRRLGAALNAGRSLAAACMAAMRHGDVINTSTGRVAAAVRQWQLIDPD